MATIVYKPTKDLYNGVIAATGGVGSGIVGDSAHGSGYHLSREDNRSGDYSVRYSLDQQGPSDGAAAIDINLSDAKMKKFTKLIMDGLDKKDPRLKAVKEIIGTVDGRNVVRYTRNSPTSSPVWASSDSSHLWHIHISIFRAYINNWDVLKGIIDFLGGESGSLEGGIMIPKKGDKGVDVMYWQTILKKLGQTSLVVDGDYGSKTAAAVSAWHKAYLKREGSSAKPVNGSAITNGIALELQTEYFALRLKDKLPKGPKGDDGKDGKDGTAIVSGKVTIDLNTGKVS